ncbi:hypothetical protein Tco_0115872 [Tanacetum coccineum]
MEYCENEDDSFTNLETDYPAIVFDDTSDTSLSCKLTVSPLDNNKIDFKISFDESDDEDYMVIFDENSFSCKIISVDNLEMDSENENDKVNTPSSPSPEPTIRYIDDLDFFKYFENEFPAIAYNDLKSKSDPLVEPSVSSQHIDKFETSLSEYDEKEQNVLCLDDPFLLNVQIGPESPPVKAEAAGSSPDHPDLTKVATPIVSLIGIIRRHEITTLEGVSQSLPFALAFLHLMHLGKEAKLFKSE